MGYLRGVLYRTSLVVKVKFIITPDTVINSTSATSIHFFVRWRSSKFQVDSSTIILWVYFQVLSFRMSTNVEIHTADKQRL
jgi:hypothetical protein